MGTKRQLTREERDIVTALLKSNPNTSHYVDELDGLIAVEMADGGMGSLSLIPRALPQGKRTFGRRIAEGEFTDSDGMLVSMTINVDKNNQLYELDIWKVDFTPLQRLPDPSKIRIVWTGFPEDAPRNLKI